MNTLRPDEELSEYEIEKAKNRDKKLKSGIKTLGGLAIGSAGLAISSRILPFLSDYIPVDLAVKGISKISPKIGNYLKRGMESGLAIKDGLDFLKKQLSPKEENEDDLEQAEGITSQPPEDIKKKALGKFKQPGVMDQEKQRFEQQYGQQQQQLPEYAMTQEMFDEPQQGQKKQLNQGQGQQALMAILQKINQKLGQ